ncbi:MAG: HAMP domain-containing protein [Promethearchaeota archaeon]
MQAKNNLMGKKKGISIRTRILFLFILLCTLSLTSVGILISSFFNGINYTTKQQSADALRAQIERNMGKTALENAAIIEKKLNNSAEAVQFLAENARLLFENDSMYEPRPSYYHDLTADPPPPQPPGYVWDDRYNQIISKDVSCYYLVSGTYAGNYTNVNSTMNETIETSAHLDHVFRQIYTTHPDFYWIYMGFEIGMHRSYPWHKISNPAYDPRQRTWYQTALANNDNISYTDPYFDASGGGLMISIAKTVRRTDGSLIGVVSADLTIETIKQRILNVTIAETGYAFLITNEGKIVAHPNVTNPQPNEDISVWEPNIPESIINNMTSMGYGFGSYLANDNRYYIAYAPIASAGFSFAAIVPEKEVTGVVDVLSGSIENTTRVILIQVLIVISIAIVLAILFGLLVGGKITTPIKKLIDFASRLATRDLEDGRGIDISDFKIDKKLESQKDEIGDLTRAFKNLLISLHEDSKTDKT